MKILHCLSAALVAALLAAPAAAGDDVMLQNFLPASRATTDVFQCTPGHGPDVRIEVTYALDAKGPGDYASRLVALSVDGVALDAERVSEVNDFVGTGRLTAASAACSGENVRVSLQVFRPESIEPGDCLDAANQNISVLFEGRPRTLRIL
ncbi:hypothetical protein [Arenimonas composti]|nr:hypothetical protein [Arenimonas composti]